MPDASTILANDAAKTTPPRVSSQLSLAVRDIVAGLRRTELWGTLGWHDVQQRYRRSVIGPFWITLSMALMIAGLGFLYANLFRQDISRYFPYLTLGIIIWGFVSVLISESCTAFFVAEPAIKQMPVPLSIHVYRVVWRNVLIFAHNIVIYILVAVVFKVEVGPSALLSLVGLFIIVINGTAAGFLLGLVSARFRDIPLLLNNLTQMLFFVTPIIWMPELLTERSVIVVYNPLYYVLETVRRPLLGQSVPAEMWWVSIAFTVVACAVAFAFYVKFRRRIAYWV